MPSCSGSFISLSNCITSDFNLTFPGAADTVSLLQYSIIHSLQCRITEVDHRFSGDTHSLCPKTEHFTTVANILYSTVLHCTGQYELISDTVLCSINSVPEAFSNATAVVLYFTV